MWCYQCRHHWDIPRRHLIIIFCLVDIFFSIIMVLFIALMVQESREYMPIKFYKIPKDVFYDINNIRSSLPKSFFHVEVVTRLSSVLLSDLFSTLLKVNVLANVVFCFAVINNYKSLFKAWKYFKIILFCFDVIVIIIAPFTGHSTIIVCTVLFNSYTGLFYIKVIVFEEENTIRKQFGNDMAILGETLIPQLCIADDVESQTSSPSNNINNSLEYNRIRFADMVKKNRHGRSNSCKCSTPISVANYIPKYKLDTRKDIISPKRMNATLEIWQNKSYHSETSSNLKKSCSVPNNSKRSPPLQYCSSLLMNDLNSTHQVVVFQAFLQNHSEKVCKCNFNRRRSF